MGKRHILIFIFIVKAVSAFSQDTAWVKQDSTSYKLYALALDSLLHGCHKVVVKEVCKTENYNPPKELTFFLKDSFPNRYTVKILSTEEYNHIFKEGIIGWKTFYKKFKGYGGLYSFSPLLYKNKEHTIAEIDVDQQRGDLDGSGFEIEFILIDKIWRIKSITTTWVA